MQFNIITVQIKSNTTLPQTDTSPLVFSFPSPSVVLILVYKRHRFTVTVFCSVNLIFFQKESLLWVSIYVSSVGHSKLGFSPLPASGLTLMKWWSVSEVLQGSQQWCTSSSVVSLIHSRSHTLIQNFNPINLLSFLSILFTCCRSNFRMASCPPVLVFIVRCKASLL